MSLLGLSHLHLKPSSLRPGGVSFHCIAGTPIGTLQFAWGWRSLLSLQVYVQESTCALVLSQLSAEEATHVETVVAAGAMILAAPPAVAFLEFLQGSQRRTWSR